MSHLNRTQQFRAAVVLVLTLALGWVVLVAAADATGPTSGRAATPEEIAQLEAAYRRHERIYFDALVTGDVSLFPAVYYNDPEVPLPEGYLQSLDQAGAAVDAALAHAMPGPDGASVGFLSAKVAEVLNIHRALDARAPGEDSYPVEPRTHDPWVDVPATLLNVKIDGDHATADIVYATAEQLAWLGDQPIPLIEHHVFTRIDGQWYVSAAWTTGNF